MQCTQRLSQVSNRVVVQSQYDAATFADERVYRRMLLSRCDSACRGGAEC